MTSGRRDERVMPQRFLTTVRLMIAGAISVVAACTAPPVADAVPASKTVASKPAEPPTTDSVASIARFVQLVTAIDRDTAGMQRVVKPLRVGAGAGGTVTGWRFGPVWQRVRAETVGDRFRTRDEYWFSNGVLLGARLTVTRSGRRDESDHVWFVDNKLYRWTDAEGRHLNREARSTQYQLLTLRTALDSLMRTLSIVEPARR